MLAVSNPSAQELKPEERKIGLENAVIPRHPVWQYVIDSSGFDRAIAPARQVKRVSLPQEIGRNSDADRQWIARPIVATSRKLASIVDKHISPRPRQPVAELGDDLGIALTVRSVERPV